MYMDPCYDLPLQDFSGQVILGTSAHTQMAEHADVCRHLHQGEQGTATVTTLWRVSWVLFWTSVAVV